MLPPDPPPAEQVRKDDARSGEIKPMRAGALLVSTDNSLIESVQRVLDSVEGLELRVFSAVEELADALLDPSAVLALFHCLDDLDLPQAERLLGMIASAKRPVATVILGEEYNADHALALLRKGAADYLGRPLDLGRLSYVADILTIRARYATPPAERPATEALQLGNEQPYLYVPSGPTGQLLQQVRRVAPHETTILLTGETGTGKTCLARLIHEMSPRREKPFLTVHCGSLSVHLIASELFGHVKGAFTGAERDRTGKLSEVGAGTLLLDEIDALPVELQSQLLRVVEERVFEQVGSNHPLRMEARLIVATNRALDQEVAAGRFRSDLYYRLNVVGFHLTPLRERRDLIPALIEHFVAHFAGRNRCLLRGLTPDTLRALQSYSWPGNVRELRNVIERAVALCPSEMIEVENLPDAVRQTREAPAATGLVATRMNGTANSRANGHLNGAAGATLAKTKEDAEIRRITQALARHKNNRLRAAAELGISRMALYKKLHRYGMMGET